MSDTPPPPPTPAGWYPTDQPGQLRWWDGAAWTDNMTEAPAPPTATAQSQVVPAAEESAAAEPAREAEDQAQGLTGDVIEGVVRGGSKRWMSIDGDVLRLSTREDRPWGDSAPIASLTGFIAKKNTLTPIGAAAKAGKSKSPDKSMTFTPANFIHAGRWAAFLDSLQDAIDAVDERIEYVGFKRDDGSAAPAVDPAEGHYLAGIRLLPHLIIYGTENQPLKGLTASVEDSGQRLQTKRGFFTGANVHHDVREIFVVITDTKYQWRVKVRPSEGSAAHAFVAKVNTAGIRANV